MGNLLFCILHLFAIMFGFVLLVVTVPLHIIYCAMKGKRVRKTTGSIWTRDLW